MAATADQQASGSVLHTKQHVANCKSCCWHSTPTSGQSRNPQSTLIMQHQQQCNTKFLLKDGRKTGLGSRSSTCSSTKNFSSSATNSLSSDSSSSASKSSKNCAILNSDQQQCKCKVNSQSRSRRQLVEILETNKLNEADASESNSSQCFCKINMRCGSTSNSSASSSVSSSKMSHRQHHSRSKLRDLNVPAEDQDESIEIVIMQQQQAGENYHNQREQSISKNINSSDSESSMLINVKKSALSGANSRAPSQSISRSSSSASLASTWSSSSSKHKKLLLVERIVNAGIMHELVDEHEHDEQGSSKTSGSSFRMLTQNGLDDDDCATTLSGSVMSCTDEPTRAPSLYKQRKHVNCCTQSSSSDSSISNGSQSRSNTCDSPKLARNGLSNKSRCRLHDQLLCNNNEFLQLDEKVNLQKACKCSRSLEQSASESSGTNSVGSQHNRRNLRYVRAAAHWRQQQPDADKDSSTSSIASGNLTSVNNSSFNDKKDDSSWSCKIHGKTRTRPRRHTLNWSSSEQNGPSDDNQGCCSSHTNSEPVDEHRSQNTRQFIEDDDDDDESSTRDEAELDEERETDFCARSSSCVSSTSCNSSSYAAYSINRQQKLVSKLDQGDKSIDSNIDRQKQPQKDHQLEEKNNNDDQFPNPYETGNHSMDSDAIEVPTTSAPPPPPPPPPPPLSAPLGLVVLKLSKSKANGATSVKTQLTDISSNQRTTNQKIRTNLVGHPQMSAFIPPQFSSPPQDGANIKPSEYLRRVGPPLTTSKQSYQFSVTSSTRSGDSVICDETNTMRFESNGSQFYEDKKQLAMDDHEKENEDDELFRDGKCVNIKQSNEQLDRQIKQESASELMRRFERLQQQTNATANSDLSTSKYQRKYNHKLGQLENRYNQTLSATTLSRSQSTSALSQMEQDIVNEEIDTNSNSSSDSLAEHSITRENNFNLIDENNNNQTDSNDLHLNTKYDSNLMQAIKNFDKNKFLRALANNSTMQQQTNGQRDNYSSQNNRPLALSDNHSNQDAKLITESQQAQLDILLAATKRSLIAELKESKGRLEGIKRSKQDETRRSQGELKQLVAAMSAQFKPEDFLEQVSEPETPLWRRQMLAKKAAERAKREFEAQARADLEQRQASQVPAWKRQVLAKLAAKKVPSSATSITTIKQASILATSSHVGSSRPLNEKCAPKSVYNSTNKSNVHCINNGPEIPAWKRKLSITNMQANPN